MRWKTEHYFRIAGAFIFFIFSIFMFLLALGFMAGAQKNGMSTAWAFMFLPLLFFLGSIVIIYPVIRDCLAPGDITIALDKAEYLPGDTISGKATLRLKKPMAARAFIFRFYGSAQRGKLTNRVYDDDIQLSGKRTYGNVEEFDFSFKIPADLEKYARLSETYDELITDCAVWHVELRLDLEKKTDIVESVRIKLTKRPKSPESD